MLVEEKELFDEKFKNLSQQIESINKTSWDNLEEIKAFLEQHIAYVETSQKQLGELVSKHETEIQRLREANIKCPIDKIDKRLTILEDATGVYVFFAKHKMITAMVIILVLIAPVQQLVELLIKIL